MNLDHCCCRLSCNFWAVAVLLCTSRQFIRLRKLPERFEPGSYVDVCEVSATQNSNNDDTYCNPQRHGGPYLIIGRPHLGYFNQYMHLVGMLYLVQHFRGTIVFPANATTRRRFVDFHDTEWIPSSSSVFFDLPHLITYWKERNVSLCVESKALTDNVEVVDFCTVLVPAPSAKEQRSSCNGAHRLALTPDTFMNFVVQEFINRKMKLSGNTAISIKTFWGNLPPANTYSSNVDNSLSKVQLSSFSLRFSQRIACAGRLLVTRLKLFSSRQNRPIVGVHARLEEDWHHRTSDVPGPKAILDQLEEGIRRSRGINGIAYIAVGDLINSRKVLLETWANRNFGNMWYTKSSLVDNRVLAQLPIECLAAVEASVLLHVDYFLGQALSSFDVFVCEIRSSLSKPSLLFSDYLEQFRPFVHLRSCNSL